jgi:hypothetical protein
MLKYRREFRRFHKSIWGALALLVLLGFLLQNVAGSAYYSLLMKFSTAVSSPPVELQNGTAANSTSIIYENKTSALVSVDSGAGTDVKDYVDNNTSDMDNSTDIGTHSNFTAQQYGPDLINDTLTEENTESNPEYVWISGNDDYVRKLNKSDLGGTEILSWDTDTSYPFGTEFRIENGSEYIYIVDYGPQDDALIKFHASNGTEVIRWDISGYADDAYGLAWNGSRWFIVDRADNLIYQVDPANATNYERSFSYSGIDYVTGLAWDGSYLWATDEGTDKVYQIDIYGTIQTSWDAVNDPTGIAYDTTSGHLWIVSDSTDNIHEYYTNGTEINSWDPSGTNPHGVAYAFIEENFNYELDLEVQWTNVDYDEANEQLCIYGGTMGAENITVDVWNGSDWVENIFANLTSGWNNVSVTSYLTTSNFTIRFKGGNETGDTTQHTWDIDTTLLHVWTGTGVGSGDFNYVLNMTEKDGSNWKVRLKAYDNSSLSRLDNCSIYIYDGSNSTQIIISNGTYDQQTGPWYNLTALDTEYIWMHVETSSFGTSKIYTYLEIRVPNSTVYARYIITFKIT